jgi:MFS family permease
MMSPYLQELRVEWRALSSAMIGLACGLVMNSYVAGIMGPYLVEEFGWSKSQIALIGALALGTMFVFPLVGRLADVIGVRKTALIGLTASPLLFLAFSQLNDIRTYAILFGLQCVILTTTTPPVYCRVIVQYISRARGLALAIAASGPAIITAVGGPLLNNFVAEHGWRAGYLALVAFSTIAGLAAFLLLPPERKDIPAKIKRKTAKEDYALIFRTPAFWVLISAMLLCNLPQAVMVMQFNLILAENGAVGTGASAMISAFAVGMLSGRFVAGLALDRFPPKLVATIGLALSAAGFMLIATSFDHPMVLLIAVLLIGLSFGAESDVIAYLVVRCFGVQIYSSVYGLIAATVAISSVMGAGLISLTLKLTGAYSPFLWLTSVLVFIGSLLFLLLPRNTEGTVEHVKVDEAEDEHSATAKAVS